LCNSLHNFASKIVVRKSGALPPFDSPATPSAFRPFKGTSGNASAHKKARSMAGLFCWAGVDSEVDLDVVLGSINRFLQYGNFLCFLIGCEM
jgi:hypothetical protein